MSNEISKTITTRVSKGGSVATFSKTDAADMSGAAMASLRLTATTSWVALPIPSSITAPCHIQIHNADSANYVEIAVDSGGTYIFAKLRAGEITDINCIPAIPYVRANTASVACNVTAYSA